jgi:hypothetical protein
MEKVTVYKLPITSHQSPITDYQLPITHHQPQIKTINAEIYSKYSCFFIEKPHYHFFSYSIIDSCGYYQSETYAYRSFSRCNQYKSQDYYTMVGKECGGDREIRYPSDNEADEYHSQEDGCTLHFIIWVIGRYGNF